MEEIMFGAGRGYNSLLVKARASNAGPALAEDSSSW